MNNVPGGDPARGIGARLRAARERRGLSLLQAAEKLHVDARVLQALEAQDFAALGADVYVRGHLRRYAELIGESAPELSALYSDSGQVFRPDLTRIPRGEPRPAPSPVMLPALLAVVGLALAGAVWWLMTVPGERARPLAALVPPAPPAAGAAPVASELPADSALPGASAPPVASSSPADGPAREATVSVPSAATTNAPAARAGEARLELRFSAPSWVEISDAGERRLLHGMVAGGSTRTLSGAPPLRLVIGSAPSVALQLDGQPVSLAGFVHSDGSARVLVDAAGRASAAPPRLAPGE